MSDKKFATAINCMDGRVQKPMIEFMEKKFGVDYVDMITEPGPIKILAENTNTPVFDQIKKRVDISVNKHNSKVIAIAGHFDCAGNPVPKEIQMKQVLTSIETVKSWNFDAEIIGLWIDESWKVTEI